MTGSLLLAVAVGVVTALGVALFWVGRPGVDPEPLIRGVPRDPEPGTPLLASLAAHLIAPLRTGNSVGLHLDADEIFPAMLEAVDQARTSVDFLTYIFKSGRVASEFVDALEAAARRGVSVRLLVDAVGGAGGDDSMDRLEAAGAQVARFHPLGRLSLDRLNQRTHRKILVVDGERGFVGGVGIADAWQSQDGRPAWREDQFRFAGPAIADLLGGFAENWRQATGEVLFLEDLEAERRGEATAVALLDRPGDGTSHFRLALWMALRAAQVEVRIRTPYFLPGPDLVHAMGDTAARGVRVSLLLPGDRNDSPLVRLASRARYSALLKAGVALWEYQPSMMHAKGVTVDGRLAILGSHNIDQRSLRLNFEFGFAVEDEELVAEMDASFDADLTESIRVDREVLGNRGLADRLGGWLALGMERFL